jgi:nucleolar protein 4
VRSAFVVLEAGSGVSKGVGYVSFSVKEDAEVAFKKIEDEGMTLDGRKLRVQWAENKVRSCSVGGFVASCIYHLTAQRQG